MRVAYEWALANGLIPDPDFLPQQRRGKADGGGWRFVSKPVEPLPCQPCGEDHGIPQEFEGKPYWKPEWTALNATWRQQRELREQTPQIAAREQERKRRLEEWRRGRRAKELRKEEQKEEQRKEEERRRRLENIEWSKTFERQKFDLQRWKELRDEEESFWIDDAEMTDWRLMFTMDRGYKLKVQYNHFHGYPQLPAWRVWFADVDVHTEAQAVKLWRGYAMGVGRTRREAIASLWEARAAFRPGASRPTSGCPVLKGFGHLL